MGRKPLTHEEFMERFYIKNKNAENIEILGEYVSSKSKIKVRCKIDEYEWEATPNNLLKGQGCPKCSGNIRNKTTEEFKQEMKKINDNIEILGKYVNAKTKIKCKCKIDGYEFEMKPNDLLKGQGCPKCAGNIKKTTEEFKQEIKDINDNIEILGEYINNKIKIKCKCKIDGHEWEMTPNSLLNGQGCPKCGIKSRVEKRSKTHKDFIKEIKKINDDIEILGEYVNSQTKIKVRCKKDDYEWEMRPNDLLNNHGCPKCYGNNKLTHEEFINELKEINDNIEILGEYVNNRTKIKCKCKIDGHEWEATPNSLLSRTGCPKCNESKGEKRIGKYLDSKNIDYERQHKFDECKSKKELPFDFYIPSLNMAIEYDGEYHYMIITRGKNDTYKKAFNRFVEGKIRDTIKTIYCKENNIKLIRIPYWNFNNIEEILEREF